MCGVETRNCFTYAGKCLSFSRNLIMELSEDRGIECQGVSFDFIDGKVVLAVYQNLPGIKRHLAGTTFLKAFTIDDWKAVNRYLGDMVGDDDVIEIDSEGKVHPPEAVSVLSEIQELRKVNNIPKMSNAVAILPENRVPATSGEGQPMTKDEIQEKFDSITGTQNEEEGKDGKE